MYVKRNTMCDANEECDGSLLYEHVLQPLMSPKQLAEIVTR